MFSTVLQCRDTVPTQNILFNSYLILSELFPCEGEVPRRGEGVGKPLSQTPQSAALPAPLRRGAVRIVLLV